MSADLPPVVGNHAMTKPDPIFTAVEMQRRASARVAELKHLVDVSTDADGTLWDEFSAAIDVEHDAAELVCATMPVTAAGALALSRFIRERLVNEEMDLFK